MGIVYLILVLGVSTILWSSVGLIRVAGEWHHGRYMARHGRESRAAPPTPADVAVLVAAHNEELVIMETIRAAKSLVPQENIFVVSDYSTDKTAELARAAGVHVLELTPNRGKAGALAAGIEEFDLCRKFQVVMLLDADTRPSPDYLTTGLPLFTDRSVVAVAGRARSLIRPAAPTAVGRLLVSYRERLYTVVQLLLKYGQAARNANVVNIVPGFASMYRTTALAHVDITPPGLVIEDFNMTFEIHAKKLGRIAFHPAAAVAYTQDPDSVVDYMKQTRRWVLGFWQTVRRHKVQSTAFWGALLMYIVELLLSCVFMVLLIPVFIASLISASIVQVTADHAGTAAWLSGLIRPEDVLVGVLLPDFLLTMVAVIALRRPHLLIYAPLFPLIRVLDAALCLSALPKAMLGSSDGVWASPTRRVQAAHAEGHSEVREEAPAH